MISVTVSGMIGGDVEELGQIVWTGKKLVIKPRSGRFRDERKKLLTYMVQHPIRWPKGNTGEAIEVWPADDPERFVRNLCRQYRCYILCAWLPVETTDA